MSSIEKCLMKANHHDLFSDLAADALDFAQNLVRSIKNFNCCNAACVNCPGSNILK